MYRGLALALFGALLVQDAPDPASEKATLHADLAAASESVGDQLIKVKAWDEARAFLEMVRAKSDARGDALDKLIAKTEKQTSGLKWDAKPSELIKSFGAERAKKFFAYAKAWKEKDAESSRWTEAEAEILDDFLDYVKAYARLTQIRAHYELPKTRFDWKLSVPAVWHAKYLLLNPKDAREVEGKPGFTLEGSATSEKAVSSSHESITDLVESILHAPFYRNYVLNGALHTIALGQGKGQKSSSAIDVESGLTPFDSTYSMLHIPRNGSTNVPLTGYDDYSPIFANKTMRQLGYPISLVFYDPTKRPSGVKARITENMKDVDFHISTPENPVGTKITAGHRNTILLATKEPLRPGTEYKISISFRDKGEERIVEWSFRTTR